MSLSRVEFSEDGNIFVDVPGNVFKKMKKIIVWDEDNHKEKHFYDPANIGSKGEDDIGKFDIPEIPKDYDDKIVNWVSIDTPPTTETSKSTYYSARTFPIVVFNEYEFDYYIAQYYYEAKIWKVSSFLFTNEEMKQRGFACWLDIPWPLKKLMTYKTHKE